MDQVNGWAEVLRRLGGGEAEIRGQFVRSSAVWAVGEDVAVAAARSESAEDVLKVDADEDGNGGDDAADCMRYLVATKSRAVTQRKLRGL